MLAPVVIAAVIAAQGWRASFFYGALVTFILAIGWYARVRNGVPQTPRVGSSQNNPLRLTRTLVLLTIPYSAMGFFCAFFDNWVFYYLCDVRNYGHSTSAWFTTATQASIMLGLALGGWIVDRIGTMRGRRLFLVSVHTISATSLITSGLSAEGGLVIILLCLAYGVSSLTDACFAATSLQAGGTTPATFYGVMNGGFAAGLSIGSAIIPVVAGAAGWNAALFGTAAIVRRGLSMASDSIADFTQT